MKLNIVGQRKVWFAISGALLIGSILAIALFGLRFGIDFVGGTLLEIRATESVEVEMVRTSLEELGYTDVAVQSTEVHGFLIRTSDLSEEEHQTLLVSLEERIGAFEELRFDSIGPVIGAELRRTAVMSIVATLLLIGLYVAWAYRKVALPVASWKYGILTVLTAFHDVIIPVGIFAVLGRFFGWEIDAAFVAAILTILGYSINDTVVLFDRTRENLLARVGHSFEETVELSIHQTLTRSMSTGMSTLLALVSIFLLGGDTTKPFALALILGIIVGTYSSIFLASPALVAWEQWVKKT
ncbi:MAG: protein translocase subunit SecF [Patescibacteria group bacterium]